MIAAVSKFFRAHPMLKGMAVYSVIWPTSCTVQQLIAKEEIDWRKNFRFFLFGTFFVAPTLYGNEFKFRNALNRLDSSLYFTKVG